jgi:hypothetical protein
LRGEEKAAESTVYAGLRLALIVHVELPIFRTQGDIHSTKG